MCSTEQADGAPPKGPLPYASPTALHRLFTAGTGLGLLSFGPDGSLLHDPVAPDEGTRASLVGVCDHGPALVAEAARAGCIGSTVARGVPLLLTPVRFPDGTAGALAAGPVDAAAVEDPKSLVCAWRQLAALADTLSTEPYDVGPTAKAEAETTPRTVALLTALHHIGMQLTSNLDPTAVLHRVVDTATYFLGARRASLMLLDSSQEHLTIATARGLEDSVVEATCTPLGQGIAGWVARTGQPRMLAEGVRDSASVSQEHPQAALSVPLKARDQVIGVLNVSERIRGGDFADEDLELLLMLANQAAIAIDNARLHQAQEHKLREISALYEIGRALNSSLERDDTLKLVLRCAMALLHARHGSLMLLDDAKQTLEIVASEGLSDEVIRQARPRLDQGIVGRVARTGQPVLLRRGERHGDSASPLEATPATLCVPIQRDEEIIGVLNVRDREDGGDFSTDDLELLVHLSAQAAVAIDNSMLHESLHQLFMGTVKALVNAIDARDPYTEKHSERVRAYSIAIARHLGFPDERLHRLQIAALLHDIGKISISDRVLQKPGALTPDEYALMKQHPVVGARIIGEVGDLRPVVPFLYHHHEHYDGPGYPEGIQGEQIPIEARIIAVADTFDAMTSARPYRDALPREVAVRELRCYSGTQFDPQIVGAFLDILDSGAIDPMPAGEPVLGPPEKRVYGRDTPVSLTS